MAALLRLLVLVCALFAPASAFVAPSMPLCRSAVAPAAAVTMGCRQNLKKEKRVRNRINAFRFKKNSARRRCHRPLARAAHAGRRLSLNSAKHSLEGCRFHVRAAAAWQ